MPIPDDRIYSFRLIPSMIVGLLFSLSLAACGAPTPAATQGLPAAATHTATSQAAATLSTEEVPVLIDPTVDPYPLGTPLGGGGRIVFSSERAEKYSYDLYSMNPDGSDVQRITDTSDESELSPSWSPDGDRIVYRSFSNARSDFLYVMNRDGSGKQRILTANRYAGDPDWTEAGIVYYEGRCKIDDCWSDVEEMTTEIYVIQPDGSGRTPLTFTLHRTLGPAWSPDFEQIVYSYGTSFTLHLMNADGSAAAPLVAIPGDSLDPAWSPDGEWIAFSSNQHDRRDLYMVRPDGSDLTRLTDDPHHDWFPAWSPDGKYIVFTSERYGEAEICLLEVASGEVTRLTDSPLNDKMPDWAP